MNLWGWCRYFPWTGYKPISKFPLDSGELPVKHLSLERLRIAFTVNGKRQKWLRDDDFSSFAVYLFSVKVNSFVLAITGELFCTILACVFWENANANLTPVLKGWNSDFQPVIQDVCRLVRGISSRDNSSLTAYIFNLQHFSLIYSLVFKVLLVLLQPSYCTLTSKSYFLS